MADRKKLDRWAEKLLDTGKRNNLISFKDTKASTAEVVFPNCEAVFSKCSVGHAFDVYDPHIPDEDSDTDLQTSLFSANKDARLSKADHIRYYSQRMSGGRLLFYSQTPNPITAVKNIAKKAQLIQEETGLNVAYLVFGFLEWTEKTGSDIVYRAPLILVHVNIITGSVLDPVKIEISDDDLVINPTFNYRIKSDYGIELPEYEDGETLESYYSKVSSVVSKLGWKVLNECKLGIFSFLKINMYEDLKNNAEQILKNSNVRALIGESIPEEVGFSTDDVRGIVENPLVDLHTVVDADSSQIEAIEMAKSGKSFVLQGPPGTGKSQTITNIIAECLHDGKKVLFVSEKQAALNVVYEKLKKAGLSDFCLELHSHKANKNVVINELNRTLEAAPIRYPRGAFDEIRRKKEALSKLDEYEKALHANRSPVNKSLYQLFELYSSDRGFPEIHFRLKDIENKGEEWFLAAIKTLEQYVEYIPSIGANYRENSWYGFIKEDIDYEEQITLKTDLEKLLEGYCSLKSKTAEIKTKYETPDLNFSDTVWLRSFLEFSAGSDAVTPALLTKSKFDHAFPILGRMRNLCKEIVPERDRILERYTPGILSELSGAELHSQLTEKYRSGISRLFSGEYKQLIARLKQYSVSNSKPSYKDAVALSDSLKKMQAAKKVFDEIETQAAGYLGSCYKGVDTDWEAVFIALDDLRKCYDYDRCSYGSLPSESFEKFVELKKGFKDDSETLEEDISSVSDAKARVSQLFASNILDLEKDSYDYCIRKIEGCLRNFGKLSNWIAFSELLYRANSFDLLGFIDLAIENELAPEEIVGSFRRQYYENWIEAILFSSPELKSFSRIRQDQAVKEFCSKDALQYEISKLQIKAALSQKRPDLSMVAGGSSVAVLRREGQKKRKKMPIRKLLSETAELAQLLKPCFMMSPLSVSTFLDPEKISFDTVVFDEASQIFPQDAIGAVYRGAQLIVVGDSRQMPPSNFFTSSMDNDEDEDEEVGDVTDFESLLDIGSSVFNTERLAWHYRSHYEQLIAFSNLNFYNNKLVTFPSASADHKGIGVDFYRVDGVFDRRTKTNRAEAEFIVDLIYQNIAEYPKRSLGVVAFSAAQQNLIDKLLSRRRESNPSIEWFFSSDRPEPFFIKNLETVQGDERDTIIFSVAYARDSQGRFINNFGPLNREGGERRLNVAVTRAKDNVQLVSSIVYTDIDLKGAGSEGARLLRAYLDYAQNGETALERGITVRSEDSFDSDFELEVCEFLRDKGFTVDTQIGCSGFKIDMGIRLPGSSNYVLAVECDGASYHASKNARDRDSLRQRVLENMGWQFYRIWSTDWYKNNAVEKENLLRIAREAVRRRVMGEEIDDNNSGAEVDTASDSQSRFAEEKIEKSSDFPKYKQLDALDVFDRFHYSFPSAVKEILNREAPLSEEYLLKRIVSLFGREKVTNLVRDKYHEKMQACERYGIVRKNGFLYLSEMNKIRLRIPGDRRDIQYIAVEELADGVFTLVKQNVSITKDGLYKTMTNLLGFSRTGESIVERYDLAVDLLKRNGMLKETNGVLSIA
ncbi:MAG: DUF4011 domain-containing protein [Clostridiales bacterium]|nr:DUF4011 domain-containing protein [Clostridiales bacterium]